MTRNILEAVNNAREFFEIEDYPSDFFSRIDKVDYTNKYGILLFKEDIDKHQIVTNDKGRVFLHPEQNLFDEYAQEIGLSVLSSDEWLRQIGHIISEAASGGFVTKTIPEWNT